MKDAIERIRSWGEARNWRGYDPYDALNSPAAPFLTLGTGLGRRLLTQAVKLAPLNVRPLLGIRPVLNPKAVGLVASGYARLWAATADETARDEAERWLLWLDANRAGGGWGYPFDVQTRFFRYARGTPNTIATSFVAQAFLDGAELLKDERWRESALQAAAFLRATLSTGGDYFRYLPGEDDVVHNANLLACAVFARAGLMEPAVRPLETSLRAQREDGSWPYAEGPQGTWVDNFHTAYVLESLALCAASFPEVRGPLERGLDFWERGLFEPDGTPRYAVGSLYPIDAHCYASAIDAWVAADRLEPAARTARLLIERMLDPTGYVWFQKRRLWTSRIPFVRWTTAPSFRALSGLLLSCARNETGERAAARLD